MALYSNTSGWLSSPTLPTGDITLCFWFQWNSTPSGFLSVCAVDNGSAFFDIESNSAGSSSTVHASPPSGTAVDIIAAGTNAWAYIAIVMRTANAGVNPAWGKTKINLSAKTTSTNGAARAGTLGIGAESSGAQLGPVIHGNFIVYDHALDDFAMKAQAFQSAPMFQGCWAWLDFQSLLRVGKDRSGNGNNFTNHGTWVQSSLVPPVPESSFPLAVEEILQAPSSLTAAGYDPPTGRTISTVRQMLAPDALPSVAVATAVSFAPDAPPMRARAIARPSPAVLEVSVATARAVIDPPTPLRPAPPKVVRVSEELPPIVLATRWVQDAVQAPAPPRRAAPRDELTPPVSPVRWAPDPVPVQSAPRPGRVTLRDDLPPLVLPVRWFADAIPKAPPPPPKRTYVTEELPTIVLAVPWFADAAPQPRARPVAAQPLIDPAAPPVVRPWVADAIAPTIVRGRRPQPLADVLPAVPTVALSAWFDDPPRALRRVVNVQRPDLEVLVPSARPLWWGDPPTVPVRRTPTRIVPPDPIPTLVATAITAWAAEPPTQRRPSRAAALSLPVDILPSFVAWAEPPTVPARTWRPSTARVPELPLAPLPAPAFGFDVEPPRRTPLRVATQAAPEVLFVRAPAPIWTPDVETQRRPASRLWRPVAVLFDVFGRIIIPGDGTVALADAAAFSLELADVAGGTVALADEAVDPEELDDMPAGTVTLTDRAADEDIDDT